MELRLHNPNPWRLRNFPIQTGEIPFSLEALQAFRQPSSSDPFVSDIRDSRILDVRDKTISTLDENDRCDRLFKVGQWFLLLLTICFVAVVVTLLSMVFVKVGHVLDTVDGSTMHEKVDRVLDHTMNAVMNTETATANAVAMSALAKSAVQEAHPKLIHALNQSSQMFNELRDFSSHPSWTVSTGRRT